MERNNRFTPDGTKDFVFEECDALERVRASLREVYAAYGYREVKTPTLEFFDTFANGVGSVPQSELYTLTDNSGRLLALRAESTKPIARLYASRLKQKALPLRLFYDQPVFRRNVRYNRKADEFQQSGVELLGASGFQSDLEALTLAIRTMQTLFGDRFYIEIGHMGIIKTLLDGISSSVLKEEIRCAVAEKNYPETARLAALLGKKGEALAAISSLFGGAEVLEKAAVLFPDAKESLAELTRLYTALAANGVQEQVIIDLAVLNDYEYYTGLVFKGYVKGEGAVLLSGGRYDTLYGDYDLEIPAVGYAFGVSRAARILTPEKEEEKPLAVLYLQTDLWAAADAARAALAAAGYAVSVSLAASADAALREARARGAVQFACVAQDGSMSQKCI